MVHLGKVNPLPHRRDRAGVDCGELGVNIKQDCEVVFIWLSPSPIHPPWTEKGQPAVLFNLDPLSMDEHFNSCPAV